MIQRFDRIALGGIGVALLALMPAVAGAAQTELRGRVTDQADSPVVGAQVLAVRPDSPPLRVRTNAAGEFTVAAEPPATIEVEHPRFEPWRLELDAWPAEPLSVRLTARRDVVRDEIAVSASRSQGTFSAQSISASVLTPEELTELPNAVGEMVAEVPGVSQNGQGGLFQTYSVRGVSRQRVLTLVEGMRIVGERRAGVSASFLDPLLIGSVEVVRGPSSTYWGSGALGGVVQLFPKRFDGTTVSFGYSTQGDERFASVGHGGESERGSLSWGFAAREAGLGEDPSGEALFSSFEQASASLAGRWKTARTAWEALVLASHGNDIGKANTDFPERTTSYPDESHLLFHLSASRDDGWRFEAWAHPNDLETRVETENRGVDTVENEAFDWGLDAQREVRLAAGRTARWGLDLFARQDVSAREDNGDLLGGPVTVQRPLAGAFEHELGLYGALEAELGDAEGGKGPITLLTGGRLAYQRQGNEGFESSEDSAVTAFVGAVMPLATGIELTANLGTGLRFPSISERFFTGTTGRGFVTGNPALEPESSIAADAGFRWVGDAAFLAASIFHTEIDDYIERIEVEEGQLTFVNLASGTIRGLELDGGWRLAPRWSASFGGHWMEGEADDGTRLADVPAESIVLGWRREGERWNWLGRLERRFAKSDFGSGEKPIPQADLLSSSVAWQWKPGIRWRLSGRNLLDDAYFNSADRRVTLAPGRSLSLAIEWRG